MLIDQQSLALQAPACKKLQVAPQVGFATCGFLVRELLVSAFEKTVSIKWGVAEGLRIDSLPYLLDSGVDGRFILLEQLAFRAVEAGLDRGAITSVSLVPEQPDRAI